MTKLMAQSVNFASIKLILFDFDGVFTDNSVFVDQHGTESVRCFRSDGIGLARISEVGVQAMVISTETNPVVSVRASKLNIKCQQGIQDKAAAVRDACSGLNIGLQNVMFVGNDINDIPALNIVGFPVGVADSYFEVDEHILYKTERRGGYGAVREICDLVYNAIQARREI
jgi:3-deoxy-D-manno-octulosonate 8-phosphate phosphatase (KDO 8-P phosphatase)